MAALDEPPTPGRAAVAAPRETRRPLLPSTIVVLSFTSAIIIGWFLLLLPASAAPQVRQAEWEDALFTATSAVTVTGLAVVDTGTHWSAFGKLVILLLIQLGGLGMVTAGTGLLLVTSRRLRLRTRLLAQAESPGLSIGDLSRVLRFAITFSFSIEAVLMVLLTATFAIRYDYALGEAAWYGLFHTVSAFNNAGFALFPDSLVGFQDDPFVLGIIMVAIILGGLGLPVYLDVRRHGWRPRRWSVHSKLTIGTTAALLVIGSAAIAWFEWTNPGTHATSGTGASILNGMFGSVTARTAGFNTFDYGQATEETLLVTQFLMFIGGGSASTAGGIKVTTFIVLMLVVWAEARGGDVVAADRRIPNGVIRQALAVAVSYVFLAAVGVMLLLALSDEPLRDVMFEAISAISTVGLSTGVTGELHDPALFVLMVLMVTGRLGAMTLASAFALRSRRTEYRLPKGSPVIG